MPTRSGARFSLSPHQLVIEGADISPKPGDELPETDNEDTLNLLCKTADLVTVENILVFNGGCSYAANVIQDFWHSKPIFYLTPSKRTASHYANRCSQESFVPQVLGVRLGTVSMYNVGLRETVKQFLGAFKITNKGDYDMMLQHVHCAYGVQVNDQGQLQPYDPTAHLAVWTMFINKAYGDTPWPDVLKGMNPSTMAAHDEATCVRASIPYVDEVVHKAMIQWAAGCGYQGIISGVLPSWSTVGNLYENNQFHPEIVLNSTTPVVIEKTFQVPPEFNLTASFTDVHAIRIPTDKRDITVKDLDIALCLNPPCN